MDRHTATPRTRTARIGLAFAAACLAVAAGSTAASDSGWIRTVAGEPLPLTSVVDESAEGVADAAPPDGTWLLPVVHGQPLTWLEFAAARLFGNPSELHRTPTGNFEQLVADASVAMNDAQRTAAAVAADLTGDPSVAAWRVDTGGVLGPSGGLTLALLLIDAASDGSLTGGQTVAATGRIDRAGQVAPVGGVDSKVGAAREAGASVVLVPAGQAGAGTSVPVGSVAEALAVLCQQPQATSAMCP